MLPGVAAPRAHLAVVASQVRRRSHGSIRMPFGAVTLGHGARPAAARIRSFMAAFSSTSRGTPPRLAPPARPPWGTRGFGHAKRRAICDGPLERRVQGGTRQVDGVRDHGPGRVDEIGRDAELLGAPGERVVAVRDR